MMAKEATTSKWEELKGKPVCGIQGSYYNKKMTEEFGIQLVAFKTNRRPCALCATIVRGFCLRPDDP